MRRIAAAALVLLAACGKPVPEGRRLTVTVVGAGDTADTLARRLAAEASLPTLVARDGAGQIVPGLASSWRFVDDGRSLILRLRPLKWHDGRDLTASDVVAAFRRAALRRDPAVRHAGFAGADAVAAGTAPVSRLGVLAPIARVVEIRLAAASPLLLGWLADPGLAVTRPGAAGSLAPYEAHGAAKRLVLTRRSMTMQPDARPAEIILASTDDAAAAVAAFARGTTDVVIGDGLAGLGEARITARADALRIDPLSGVYGYAINSRREALADPRVRDALAMAVDRTALVAGFGLAAIAPVETLLPPDLDPLGPTLPAWRGLAMADRRAAAQRLMLAAGWSPARPLRLVLLSPPGREHQRIAEAIAAGWAALGVTLTIAVTEPADIARRVARGDFDLAVSEHSLATPDAGALLSAWRCGAGPGCDPVADAALDAAAAADPLARPALLADAEARLMQGPPLVPLFGAVRWALVGRNVDGWTSNAAGSHPLARLTVQ